MIDVSDTVLATGTPPSGPPDDPETLERAGGEPDAPAPKPSSRAAWWWLGALALLAVVLSTVAVVVASGGDDGAPAATVTKTYTIKLGTKRMVDAGIKMQNMPTVIPMRVGDTLEVVNEDDADHEFGVLTVRAGETARYSFPHAGTYRGDCTTDPGGVLTIQVFD